ncbi:glycine cleavage T C-terminal barrel domain-containing protein [Halapricum hydrolyticum]|uniref:Aminomethyl transferase family protein n=1 Tax=Halapricum hydrolyticum TaxID=2979991 RepID=A0AAE3IAG1_9EURY|nr:glycine cleavage T C-terminal barrel domain-containing protein [Halapricum hydrolyticum]MCU4717757.1 aminomethyl transferase family protein [Halapricum hydrolyticum]MCU4726921.1 aminomethyl transferase family protein [Halapricum hydrolyticum]
MSVIESVHEDHGATFRSVGGKRVVADYGRPERTHRAVRNVAGVIELGYDVREVTGPDRIAAVERASTANVPRSDGEGCYGFVLEDGAIAADAYVYNAGERLLALLSPGRGDRLDRALSESGAESTDLTDELAVFSVHGSQATEKIASVLSTGGGAPVPAHTFVRGSMGDEGVTVVASDAPTGEAGYEVVCGIDDAKRVFDTLVNRGLNAAPFGYRTWESLTLEAGTPLFEPDLAGRSPAVLTQRGDREGRQLVGLVCEALPDPGATVYGDGAAVGTVTRALESPTLDEPIAFAVVAGEPTAVETDAGRVEAREASLPFVEGSERSRRLPGNR